jgi:hypothetical protein
LELASWWSGPYNAFAVGYDGGGDACKTYIRFPSANIPQGATILSAILTFTSHANTSGTDCRVKIYCNDVYDSVAPTSIVTGDALALTTAFEEHIFTAWLSGNAYNTPDLKTEVQEVISRTDWVSGNALGVIFVENSGSNNPKYPYCFDDGTAAYYPKLVITYSTGDNPTLNGSINLAYDLEMQGTIINGALGDIRTTIDIPISMSGTMELVPRSVLDATLTIPLSVGGTIFAPQYFDSLAYITIPKFTVYGKGQFGYFGNASIEFPSLLLSSTGSVSIIGTLKRTLPLFTLSATGRLDATGKASITLPLIELSATALAGIIGTLEKNFPIFTLSGIGIFDNTGTFAKSLPIFKVTGIGLASSYLAMVLNIKNRALTLYNNYDFNSMCRFNDKHFGATKTAIYDLDTGTTDAGTLIDWNMKTGYLDLEQKLKKKLRQAWLSYKSDGDIILTVIQPDGDEYEYTLSGIYETETGLKLKFGKGIKSKYVALDIKNVDGSTMTLDVLKLHLEKAGAKR